MNTPTTLAAYAAALALVFGAAAGVGNAVGPVGGTPAPQHGDDHRTDGDHGDGSHGPDSGAAPVAAGLSVSQDGYTLVVDAAPRVVGRSAPLAFRVLGPDGDPVTEYDLQHERELHLVVVRRDATGFQHLHPTRDASGTWSTPLLLPSAGTWKVFADLDPAGADEGVVLATDLTLPGPVRSTVLPAEQRTATVDGYTVTVQGDLVAGSDSRLAFRVSRGGRPVTDLQPYLGADGHLVALRDGDLAYLHVHPEAGDDASEVVFTAEVPSAGDYRLFLDFRHAGAVRTAALGLRAEPGDAGAEPADAQERTDDSGTHDTTTQDGTTQDGTTQDGTTQDGTTHGTATHETETDTHGEGHAG